MSNNEYHGSVIFFTAHLPGKINANKNHILPKSLAMQQWWIGSNVDFHLCEYNTGVWARGCKYGLSGSDEEAMIKR